MRLHSRRRAAPASRAAHRPGPAAPAPPGTRPPRGEASKRRSFTAQRPLLPTRQDDLLGARRGAPYTDAERKYSAAVRACLEEILQGRRRQMVLLRRDYCAPDRLAVMPPPPGVDRRGLRRDV